MDAPEEKKPESQTKIQEGVTEILTFAKKRLSLGVKKLSDNPKIYQNVRGTGSSSRYVCVAKYVGGYGLAVRYRHEHLSIRLEGPDLLMLNEEISEAGLEMKEGGNHASCHFGHIDETQMRRIVSAITYGLGLPVLEVAPLLEPTVLEGV